MWPFHRKKIPSDSLHAPRFWQEYIRLAAQVPPMDTPLESIRFVVFDTETTGLDVKQDQLLSLGAVVVKDWSIQVADRFECLVHQEYKPTQEAVSIHGILPKDDAHSLEEKAALQAFVEFIGPSVLVGHHLSFDLLMVNTVLRDWLEGRLYNPHLDTEKLARRVHPPNAYAAHSGHYSLDELCRLYGIQPHDRHTAAGDAYLTALLFLKLMARLRKRGATQLRHLMKRTG